MGCRQWSAFIQLLRVVTVRSNSSWRDTRCVSQSIWGCDLLGDNVPKVHHMNVFPSSKVSHFVCKRLADNELGYWGRHNTFTTREDFYKHNPQLWETVRTCKMVFISILFAFIFRAHFFSPLQPHNYTFCGGLKVGNKMAIHFQNLRW